MAASREPKEFELFFGDAVNRILKLNHLVWLMGCEPDKIKSYLEQIEQEDVPHIIGRLKKTVELLHKEVNPTTPQKPIAPIESFHAEIASRVCDLLNRKKTRNISRDELIDIIIEAKEAIYKQEERRTNIT